MSSPTTTLSKKHGGTERTEGRQPVGRTITISPVTRVEGHGKVTIHLNDNNEVERSHFHVVEFRGFEQFCQGRMMADMPVITTRICGICPVSHHLASAKACDDAFKVDIPPAAKKLRELMHMAQIIHSHSLHFFHLAAPDFLLGPDSDPTKRNVIGLAQTNLEVAKKAIRLRQIGQDIVERVGGRAIHPVTAIPGGMSKPLSHDDRLASVKDLDEARTLGKLAMDLVKQVNEKFADTIRRFAVLETSYMSLVNNGNLELYDGTLRMIDANGVRIEEFNPRSYLDYIGEHVEDWSYLKFPFYKKLGWPKGAYRVGPLARLNVAKAISTEAAQREFVEFRQLANGGLVHHTLYYHYARVIELLYAIERAQQLVNDPDIVSREVRVRVDRVAGEGVGVIEAPRGTLIHHYWVDDCGKIEKANLIVATAHNNTAMDASVNDVAKTFVHGGKIQEGALNLIEMAIRCYDPCLSCATHAIGQMPLTVQVFAADGTEVDCAKRSAN